ncbi:AAA family ATPase [Actinomadura mexicana]|uniref:WD40 repeat n=1 Tax=Actinomadura mexicana TaxID=134959 RepID=A0A239C0H5_9ACTN|nr:AAA family ATPase [Actinomadura mexicana]SNS13151.1 WD40 repeat [Actinomadura mexicana]
MGARDAAGFDIVPLPFDTCEGFDTCLSGDTCTEHGKIDCTSEAAAIGDLLAEFGGTAVPWAPEDGRHLNAVHTRLSEWARASSSKRSVLLWLGHGRSNRTDAALAIPGQNPVKWYRPGELAEYVSTHLLNRGDDPDWTLIVVEACGAKMFLDRLSNELLDKRTRTGVSLIASGRDQGRGYLATFRRVLADVLDGFANHTEIRLHDLLGRIHDGLQPDLGRVHDLDIRGVRPISRTPKVTEPITASMDVYERLTELLERRPEHERGHFARKAAGTLTGELAWNFVGRRDERSAITSWLDGRRNGLLAVTGRPGSGKSAVLGNVLLHSTPELADLVAELEVVPWAPDPVPAFDLSLHLTGSTIDALATSLAQAFGTEAPAAALSPSQLTDQLVETLASREGNGLTVLADALDEAQEPTAMADLFRRLAELPGVRIVLGTRPSADPANPDGTGLLDRLGRNTQVTWIERVPEDIAEFVRLSLAPLGQPSPAFDEAVADVVRLVTADEREFFDASLAVHEILADPGLLAPDRAAERAALLGSDRRALFRTALARLEREVPATRQALAALSAAQGRGLPRADRIWARAATALGAAALDDRDVAAVLKAAGPYIMLDAADGQGVYRLAHRLFQESFAEQGDRERRREVGLALFELATAAADGERPGPLNPYLVRHLSGHLAAIGEWDLLAARPHVLDLLDPRAVASDAMRAGAGLSRLPAGVLGTLHTAHLAERATPGDRPGLRQLGSAQTGGPPEAASQDAAAWEIRWSRLRSHPPHLTLAGHRGPVTGIAVVPGAGGTHLLATGGGDSTVRLWDPATGLPAGLLLDGHRGPVLTVTALEGVGGRPLLVTSTEQKAGHGGPTLRMWDVRSRQEIPLPDGQHHLYLAGTPTGPASLALATIDGDVHLIDPASSPTSPARLRTLPCPQGGVTGLAVFRSRDDAPLLAGAGHDGSVHIWNLGTARYDRSLPAANTGGIESITMLDGLLATGGEEGAVCVWDPEEGLLLRRMTSRLGAVRALTVFSGTAGRRYLAGGHASGAVSLWDPHLGRQLREPLTGHRGPVRALAAFPAADGADYLATCGTDETVKIWYPTVGSPAAPAAGAVGERTGAIAALNGGCLAFCSEGALHLWEAGDEGSPARLEAAGTVTACTAFGTSDGSSLLALADANAAEVRLWNPAAGTAVNRLRVNAVRAIGALDAPGGALLLTGDLERRLRIWDTKNLALEHEIDAGEHGIPRAVAAFRLADGSPVLASTAHAPEVRFWRFTGGPWGTPLVGHEDSIVAIAAYQGPGRRPLLATTGHDRAICFWDPVAARLLHRIPIGLRCEALAVNGEDLIVGTDEGLFALRPLGNLAIRGH